MEQNKTAILKKLHAIMGDVEYIQKDATNTHQKYNYASEKAIKEAVYPALRKHGVVFSLSTKTVEQIGTVLVIHFDYAFHDVETGQVFEGSFIGSGHHRDEKGVYSAITGCTKYALVTVLGLVTGEESDKTPTQGNDAEHDHFEAPPPSSATGIASRVQGEVVGRTESPRPPSGKSATPAQVKAVIDAIGRQRKWGGLDKLSDDDYFICEQFESGADGWRTNENVQLIFAMFPYKKKEVDDGRFGSVSDREER